MFVCCFVLLMLGCSPVEEEPKEIGTINYYGGEYSGEMKDGVPHGKGTWSHPDGYLYTGEFMDGEPHGDGTFKITLSANTKPVVSDNDESPIQEEEKDKEEAKDSDKTTEERVINEEAQKVAAIVVTGTIDNINLTGNHWVRLIIEDSKKLFPPGQKEFDSLVLLPGLNSFEFHSSMDMVTHSRYNYILYIDENNNGLLDHGEWRSVLRNIPFGDQSTMIFLHFHNWDTQ